MSCNNCNTGCNCTPCDKVGPMGAQGLKGPKGEIGDVGIQGIQGNQGEQGEQGIAGFDGQDGSQGGTGPEGIQGIIGPQGPQGPQGIQGAEGTQGSNGSDGIDGTDGIDGDCPLIPLILDCNCSYQELTFMGTTAEVPCACVNPGLSPSFCGPNILLRGQGDGLAHFAIQDSVYPVGYIYDVYGQHDVMKWRVVGNGAGVQLEMAAFNSTTANKTVPGAAGAPLYGAGQHAMTFPPSNSGDNVKLLHTGDGLWVVIEANFANGQLPIFT
jgi:hypothetical protein